MVGGHGTHVDVHWTLGVGVIQFCGGPKFSTVQGDFRGETVFTLLHGAVDGGCSELGKQHTITPHMRKLIELCLCPCACVCAGWAWWCLWTLCTPTHPRTPW